MAFGSHPALQQVTDHTPVWRYMNLAKFVALLQRKTLWFSRGDALRRIDAWEGRFPDAEDRLACALKGKLAPRGGDSPETKAAAKARYQSLEGMLYEPRHVCINCWHASEHESAALWKLYAPSGDGVAVVSTVGAMTEALQLEPRKILGGRVEYVEYDDMTELDPAGWAPFARWFRKHRSLEHEKEYRLIHLEPHGVDAREIRGPGIDVRVDLGALVQRVVLPPTTFPWFSKVVEGLVSSNGLDIAVVERSRLAWGAG